jgi:dephospho-CoA kinase
MTIGLTGGIGSGKSTIAKILISMGYPVFFSDIAAKTLMGTNHDLQMEIIAHFGPKSFENGELNRSYLASEIFSNPGKKEVLNGLIHPKVRQAFADFASASNSTLVFNEAAILFETGAYSNFDKTILVTAPIETRIERVMKRDHCSKSDVQNRMDNQWNDERKIPLADFIVQNGDSDRVLSQVEKIVADLHAYSTSS